MDGSGTVGGLTHRGRRTDQSEHCVYCEILYADPKAAGVHRVGCPNVSAGSGFEFLIQQHYRWLVSHVDANAARHPWYGPCDGLGKNGSCCECDKLIAALQQQLSVAEDDCAQWKMIASQIRTDWMPANERLSLDLAAAQKKIEAIVEYVRSIPSQFSTLGNRPIVVWEQIVSSIERIAGLEK